jgi:hypothetical protein
MFYKPSSCINYNTISNQHARLNLLQRLILAVIQHTSLNATQP